MGSASSLFFNQDPERQSLYRRTTPSDEQFEEQQERWNLLAEHLLADLRAKSGQPTRSWLQGSYKFGTQTRPVHMHDEFDIDLGIYVEWSRVSLITYAPSQLREMVQSSLQIYAAANSDEVLEVIPPKTRCCRIRYKNKFHIDVPVYHLDSEADRRRLATANGWEDSDPRAIYLWFRNKFDDANRVKVRRHVIYFKAWASLHFREESSRPSSILLTVLIAEACAVLGTARLGADDDAFRDLIDIIHARLTATSRVENPIDASENLVRLSPPHMMAFKNELAKLAGTARRACQEANVLSSADIWQEAFAHLIPMPDVTEAFTDGARNLPVPMVMPEVRVTAQPRNNPQASPFISTNKIGPIPKNCDVYFEVMNMHALPLGSEVTWIVRNEGREAENINDLGHPAGTGPVAEEHTAYKGTHYMDCVVRYSGRTIAFRRLPVIVTGQEMPRRNPAMRPPWAGLRGRR